MATEGLNEESLSRLKILVENHDGFLIAQKDLEIRGQGELMGTMQAGTGELDFNDVFREPELLNTAKREAAQVMASDPDLSAPENVILRRLLEPTGDHLTDF